MNKQNNIETIEISGKHHRIKRGGCACECSLGLIIGIIIGSIIGVILIAGIVTVIVLASLGYFSKESVATTTTTTTTLLNGFQSSSASSLLTCGKQQVSPSISGSSLNRIINGQEAVPNSWPWMVSLGSVKNNQYSHYCGGVFIDVQFVLTAAHCLELIRQNDYNLTVVVGIHSINSIYLSNLYYASNYQSHSAFNPTNYNNDIGLIKLKDPIIESSKIEIICLPSSDDTADILNKNVVMTGWGYLNSNGPVQANTLQQTVLQIINGDSRCADGLFNSSLMYCAIAKDGSTDTCSGDSGGPAMYYKNGAWYTYGITSYGSENCNVNPSRPSYYTKVPYYFDWIKQTMVNL